MTEKQPSLRLIQRMAQRLGTPGAKQVRNPAAGINLPNGRATGITLEGTPRPNGVQKENATNGVEVVKSDSPFVRSGILTERPEWLQAGRSGEASHTVSLDLAHLRRSGMITPDNLVSALSNEYRSIKRKILQKARDPQTRAMVDNLVMVTSALPKEGKTFTTVNLAITLAAERGLNVLLIDCDVVRPSLDAMFERAPREGLLDYLSGKVKRASDVMCRCHDIPNLCVMFAGHPAPNSPELISSGRMTDLLTELSTRFPDRIIVIDTPPVLGAPEAAALAPYMHQAIVVVAAGQTDRHELRKTLDGISTCKSISLLFNKAPKWHEVDYSPYYYYGSRAAADQKASSGA